MRQVSWRRAAHLCRHHNRFLPSFYSKSQLMEFLAVLKLKEFPTFQAIYIGLSNNVSLMVSINNIMFSKLKSDHTTQTWNDMTDNMTLQIKRTLQLSDLWPVVWKLFYPCLGFICFNFYSTKVASCPTKPSEYLVMVKYLLFLQPALALQNFAWHDGSPVGFQHVGLDQSVNRAEYFAEGNPVIKGIEVSGYNYKFLNDNYDRIQRSLMYSVVCSLGPRRTRPHNHHYLWHRGRQQSRLSRTATVESNSSVCLQMFIQTCLKLSSSRQTQGCHGHGFL